MITASVVVLPLAPVMMNSRAAYVVEIKTGPGPPPDGNTAPDEDIVEVGRMVVIGEPVSVP